MELYRHYKGPFYRTFGIAKHSETLEELTVYETLYDSPGGRLWVRPKSMFFEDIEWKGKTVPRFGAYQPTINIKTDVTLEDIRALGPLFESIFNSDGKNFFSTFGNRSRYMLLTALIDGRPVGFKLGYELDQTEFYSWLGGVDPEFRGFGIAKLLMSKQHEWCNERGYQWVQTKTKNRFREMLNLNIKFGFDVIGTQICHHEGDLKIILRKALTDRKIKT